MGAPTSLLNLIQTPAVHRDGPALEQGRITFLSLLPILVIHAIAFGAVWTGWSWAAVGVAAGLYVVRMFAITAFYHRYFSHRTFRTGRVRQFLFGLLGASAAQRGPLWWAAHHREHHRHSDEPPDVHSPVQHSAFWSHMGWFLAEENLATNLKPIPDLAAHAELRWLDRWHIVAPIGLALATFGLGWALARWAPALGTDGLQMFVWGFGVSTVALYHGTFTINSLAHVWGSRRYATADDSRNNFWLALITLGEGWHNNHHFHPGTARQGFFWWEVDPTWWMLWAMEKVGLISELRRAPARVYEAAREGPRP